MHTIMIQARIKRDESRKTYTSTQTDNIHGDLNMDKGKIGTYLTNGSETCTRNTCPTVSFCLRPKRQDALWIIFHVMYCVITRRLALNLLGFIDAMR
jgi:hypothetical protein